MATNLCCHYCLYGCLISSIKKCNFCIRNAPGMGLCVPTFKQDPQQRGLCLWDAPQHCLPLGSNSSPMGCPQTLCASQPRGPIFHALCATPSLSFAPSRLGCQAGFTSPPKRIPSTSSDHSHHHHVSSSRHCSQFPQPSPHCQQEPPSSGTPPTQLIHPLTPLHLQLPCEL